MPHHRIFRAAYSRIGVAVLLYMLLPALSGRCQQPAAPGRGFRIESLPAGATVAIEGEIIGKTPCLFPYELAGQYRLHAAKRGYEGVSKEVDFAARRIEVITFTLLPKSKKMAVLRSALLTGWGQHYSEQRTKSGILIALQLACLSGLGAAHSRARRAEDDYTDSLDEYTAASRQWRQEAAAWQDLSAAHSRWQRADRWRRGMLITAAALHAVNLLDALLLFPKNLRQIDIIAGPEPPAPAPAAPGVEPPPAGLTISCRLTF